jgi:hypothetical protein
MASKYPGFWNYIPGEAIELDWEATKAMFPDADTLNDCQLVALPWRAISTLISCLRFAEHWHLWGLPTDRSIWTESERERWYEISAFITETEVCLMSGCSVVDLINTNRMIVAALVGAQVDLTDPLETTVDFTINGISPRLLAISEAISGEEALEDNLTDITTALEAIAVVVAA